MKLLPTLFTTLCAAALQLPAADAQPAVRARVDAELPRLLDLYKHLHANPEISFQEVKTSARVADESKLPSHAGHRNCDQQKCGKSGEG